MVIDERARHDMYRRLEQVLGAETAETLMAHLPPVGWGEVATKSDFRRDLAVTRRDLEHEISNVEHRLRAEIHRVARSQLLGYTTIVAVLNGSMVALLKLT